MSTASFVPFDRP
ncbi:stem-specific protein TSJT1-like [Iris pallida]|uniref:Stem-specific protein TSJT1-like n=1 Tax=Iris pallida TaxID=29817 RepID=A0AAX6EFR3_IRIPA|nr:stem-specific protein TSJT1-like [Iris pallida]